MTVKVNPPPHIPLPESLKSDPRMRAWAQATDRVLFQLWNRSGGGSDGMSDLADRVTVNETDIDANTADIAANSTDITTNAGNIALNTAEISFNRRYSLVIS